MSISINVACLKCKVKLWVGQSSLEFDKNFNSYWSGYIYTGEEKTMKHLESFISEHVMRCHEVVLCSAGDGDPHQEVLFEMKNYRPKPKSKAVVKRKHATA